MESVEKCGKTGTLLSCHVLIDRRFRPSHPDSAAESQVECRKSKVDILQPSKLPGSLVRPTPSTFATSRRSHGSGRIP